MLGRYGRYELLRKVAAGGMAEVFLARYEGVGGFVRDVALKRLFSHLVVHDGPLEMFQLEARLLAEMNHPNIPQVVDLGTADETWYIAMEWVDGWNLADLWRAGARRGLMMPLPVTVGVAMQVCEALHHAHEARDRAGRSLRLVHRDVTPHNVMVTRDGVAKLMDFGVAHTAVRVEEGGAAKGTYAYMAPETVKGEPIDRRADVFALGVILYELTTGTRLFRGNEPQVMTSIVEQDAPPPSSRMPGYPPELEDIVMAALRREPMSRIGSAADLALHLEHFAMRKSWMVGPRVIAHYVQQVFPMERLPEEALALVPDAQVEEAKPPVPAEERPDEPPAREELPEQLDAESDFFVADGAGELDEALAEEAARDQKPFLREGEAAAEKGEGYEPMSSDALLVDEFELEPASLGVVLEAAFGAEDSQEPSSSELADLRESSQPRGPVVLLDRALTAERPEGTGTQEDRAYLAEVEARLAATQEGDEDLGDSLAQSVASISGTSGEIRDDDAATDDPATDDPATDDPATDDPPTMEVGIGQVDDLEALAEGGDPEPEEVSFGSPSHSSLSAEEFIESSDTDGIVVDSGGLSVDTDGDTGSTDARGAETLDSLAETDPTADEEDDRATVPPPSKPSSESVDFSLSAEMGAPIFVDDED